MSFGNTYNNNQKQSDIYNPSVYSPYRMNNGESSVDKTCMTFTYWKNSLRISIAPKKEGVADDQPQFDLENGINIYLNHTKAKILAEEMRKFMSDPVKYDNVGVPSGQGIILISRGLEFNSPSPLIVIRKIDNDGSVLASFAYQFKTDYYFSVRNYQENGSFTKVTDEYNDLEMIQMITLLEEYYKAMTCATAYTVLDQLKFEHTRTANKLNKIAEKLGIELKGGSGGGSSRSYSSTSYFANGGSPKSSDDTSGGYTSATLDDIE